MPRGPTSTQRIEDLEERIARLERRSIRVVAGMTSRNLNDRLAQELKPLNDRIPAAASDRPGLRNPARRHLPSLGDRSGSDHQCDQVGVPGAYSGSAENRA
jgi:hypothetical protein